MGGAPHRATMKGATSEYPHGERNLAGLFGAAADGRRQGRTRPTPWSTRQGEGEAESPWARKPFRRSQCLRGLYNERFLAGSGPGMAGALSRYKAGRSRTDIASRTGTRVGVNLSTVKRAIRELRDRGLVTVVFRGSLSRAVGVPCESTDAQPGHRAHGRHLARAHFRAEPGARVHPIPERDQNGRPCLSARRD